MDTLYRAMRHAEGRPRLGPRDLGVRVPSSVGFPGVLEPRVDVVPDASGVVHPRAGGMSTFTKIRRIPREMVPVAHGGKASDPQIAVFSIDPSTLPTTLATSAARKGHVTIEPSSSMLLKCYKAALEGTRDDWSEV